MATHSISTETTERALASLARSYRAALAQYGIDEEATGSGIGPAELNRKGTIEINGKAVAEVWKALGGPRVKDHVLAQELLAHVPDTVDGLYRRYRILSLSDGVAQATPAWPGADKRLERLIDLKTAIYFG